MYFCFPVNFAFVLFANDAVKMSDIIFDYIFDAKIVDDERERDITGFHIHQWHIVQVVMFNDFGRD